MAPLVRVNGDRATAETTIVIIVRQSIENLPVDMTSRARFLDRLERRDGEWKIVERAAVYEQDRLDPVVPSEAFARMMRDVPAAQYPEPYRYMAVRLASAGRPWRSRSTTTARRTPRRWSRATPAGSRGDSAQS